MRDRLGTREAQPAARQGIREQELVARQGTRELQPVARQGIREQELVAKQGTREAQVRGQLADRKLVVPEEQRLEVLVLLEARI